MDNLPSAGVFPCTPRPSFIYNDFLNGMKGSHVDVCMVPVYCNCVVCTAIVTLNSHWAIKFLGGRKWPYFLRADIIKLLKKYSSCFAYYQTHIH